MWGFINHVKLLVAEPIKTFLAFYRNSEAHFLYIYIYIYIYICVNYSFLLEKVMRCSTSHEISLFYGTSRFMIIFTNVHDCPCLWQINPTYTFAPHLFKLQYNNYPPVYVYILQTVLPFTYSDKNSVRISLFSHALPHLIHADMKLHYF